MAETDTVTISKINYYCREGYYCHMELAATEGLQKYGNDPVLKFFRAFAMILQDRVQDGMRELDILKDKKDVNICSTMALIYGHKKSKSVDRDAVQDLDVKLKEERKQAGELGLYFAGLLLFHMGKHDKAREYIDRMLKINETSKEGLIIRGWIELMSGRDAIAKKAIKYFDEALNQSGPRSIDALFGKARYFKMRNNFNGALELINQTIVAYPSFSPALVEKMKLQLALQDWEQTIETAQRVLDQEPHSIEALRYQILHLLCREGDYSEASNKIGELISALDRFEPKNAYLYCNIADVFSKVCGRNALVLQQTFTLMERALSLDTENAEFVNALGQQYLLQDNVTQAMRCHRSAMRIDETSVQALTGIINCQLLEDRLDDASQQLEFLSEIQQSIGRTAELLYLSAVLAMKKHQPQEKTERLLNEAIELHFAGLKKFPLGNDYFLNLNPDFLLNLLKDFLQFAPQQPISLGQPIHPVLKRCNQVLDALTRAVPGLIEGLFMMGRVKYLGGDVDSAQSMLQHCLDHDMSMSDAHILMAQIHLHQNNFKLANSSLELGLAHNFDVREHPLYNLIKARIFRKQGEQQEAVKVLQLAMALPGVKTTGNKAASTKKAKGQISVNDRVSVFLELAEAHRLLGEQHEAAKVMQDAMNEFQGTPEEVRITISNADLSLARGDIEMALGILRNVGPDQAYFVEAHEKMAEIYLHHRKDKRLYASCYRELLDKNPSPHTAILLGDAYISIQEPEKAIEVYETALKKNPRDGVLACKIGQALVKTHNFGKAINYYEAALKSGGQSVLRFDLAELLMKLRQYDKANKVLTQALDGEDAAMDIESMMDHVRYLTLQAKIHQKQEKNEDALLALTKARDMQSRVLKRAQVEQPDTLTAQRQLASNICSQMAQQSVNQRDYDKAIKSYKEGLTFNENDAKVMLELARLYLTSEDLDSCQHQLMTLLKSDKENDAATIMLADLMFQKNDYESATLHFQQLLQMKPDNYDALSRLVDLMRRTGKLDEVSKSLDLAEAASSRASIEPGFNYCKGLYEWYVGRPTAALKCFNLARKDSDWGHQAVYNMIEICLNPDNDTIGGEVFESVEGDIGTQLEKEKADSEQMAVKTADKLLKEIRVKPGDIRPKIRENMILIASKHKANVEKALSAFMEIATAEREHVGALYGMAAAYTVLKQTPRARNQLKRVHKNTWNLQDAEDLEKSWLLLADIFIQAAKYDMAQELLKRVLQYNKSCCKAYEYMGYIMEKEQSYKDAANNYENAWKYGNKNNPVIGYKLAFNYMKAKRYVDAIDICHVVLAAHPNYPKIKKEILDKARASLRV